MVTREPPDRGRDTTALSRRQVLSRATYGLGATLLFGTPLHSSGGATAHPASLRAAAAADGATGSAGAPATGSGGAPATGSPTGSGGGGQGAFDAMRLGAHGQPRAACRGRRGVMVVGVGDEGEPVSWMNAGRARWDERTLDRPAAGEPEVWGVAARGDRFVAVGSMLQHDVATVTADAASAALGGGVTYTASRRLPTVWWTRDSLEWRGQVITGLGERHAQLIAVCAADDRLVAVGSTLDADGVQGDGGFVLTSADDGATWQRGEIAPRDLALAEGSFTAVAHGGDGWVATSTDMDGGAVWGSPDGRRWSLLASSAGRFHGIALQGIGVRRAALYVAGTRLTDHSPVYVTSADGGRTWGELRSGPKVLAGADTTVNDLTVIADEVVVVGTQADVPVIEGGTPDATD